MKKEIRLKVKKELDSKQQIKVIKLKGSLISSGYTEIIHILDQDVEFHINSFEIQSGSSKDIHEFITNYIINENLTDSISIF